MMQDGINIKQRDIVLVPIPFSSLIENKKRPALIISNSKFHEGNEDFICCALTSNPQENTYCIEVNDSDIEEGNLDFKSKIKATKIFSLKKTLIQRTIARLNVEKTQKVLFKLNSYFKIDQ